MRFIFEWLVEQRGRVALGAACLMLAITAILRYGFDLWWPFGIGAATALAVLSLFSDKSDTI